MARKKPALIQTIDPAVSGGGPYAITDLGDYSSLYITNDTLAATTGSDNVLVEFSSDNGSTWSTDTVYFTQIYQGNATNGTNAGTYSMGQTTNNAILQIHNFNVAAPTFGISINPLPGVPRHRVYTTLHTVTTAWDAIRISKSADDFTTGNIYVWGERAPLTLIDTLSYPLTGDQTVDLTGYAAVNVVANAGSSIAADYLVHTQLAGTPDTSAGDYPQHRFLGTAAAADHTTAGFTGGFYIADVGSTTQRGAGVFHGWDMAVPACGVMFSSNNPAEHLHAHFRDAATAYDEMLSVDDAMDSGTVWVTGVATT